MTYYYHRMSPCPSINLCLHLPCYRAFQCPSPPTPSPSPVPAGGGGSGSSSGNRGWTPLEKLAVGCTLAPTAFVVIGLILCGILRCTVKGLSPPEATVLFIYRVSTLQLLLSIYGLLTSLAFVSSVLNIAGSSVILCTMRNLRSATDIARGRASACSQAKHGANLAISALVFSCVQIIVLFSDIAVLATIGIYFGIYGGFSDDDVGGDDFDVGSIV